MELKPLLKLPLSLKSKLQLHKSYIKPVMTYAVPAWGFIFKFKLNRLQTALRLIGGYDKYARNEKLHSDNTIPVLKEFINVLALKLYASAQVSRN